ncbi:MAG: hypothetical protein ABJA98_25995 [Acidobacteriota bacterium]
MHLIVIYFLCCLLMAFAGRNRRIGSVGYFLVALILTPILTALILLISAPRRRALHR